MGDVPNARAGEHIDVLLLTYGIREQNDYGHCHCTFQYNGNLGLSLVFGSLKDEV